MNALAKIYVFKIAVTLIFWSVPLILFPAGLLRLIGIPSQETYMFLRLLGWAYLALCVGYTFGLRAAIKGRIADGPAFVGIVSNGGACLYLAYYAARGAWAGWGIAVQALLWASIAATGIITVGLYIYAVRAARSANMSR